EDPALLLPMYDFSNNSYIYGYGQLTLDTFHNGIDFGVNSTTAIVAPHAAYVEAVDFWYNDKGGHWQTNVRLWLNHQWKIEIAFESWALNETYGQLQADAIRVNPGQYVEVNQTLGNLLYHGTGAHIHFMISFNNADLCPYTFFTPTSQSIFAAQFALVNYTAHWCM
ncbi:MAG: peptidoglycan DD-metalloendopeptidase family protein, partial [Candidatus Helarchaeota archaeon]|nr:peptidoglycan DD-metalloendopeptidase family protein [Candidatus Helarchaeota archaeon]